MEQKKSHHKIRSAGTLTPMMEQYRAAKELHKDALLFFRLGDFYEMFFDDAVTASQILGLTMTHRQETPMCGVPAHAIDTYLEKLVNHGYRVAVVDQVGDPKAKGLTERQVTKIVTPGTILTDDALTDAANNYLTLILEEDDEIALSGADVSTGEIFYCLYEGKPREHSRRISFDGLIDKVANVRESNYVVNFGVHNLAAVSD